MKRKGDVSGLSELSSKTIFRFICRWWIISRFWRLILVVSQLQHFKNGCPSKFDDRCILEFFNKNLSLTLISFLSTDERVLGHSSLKNNLSLKRTIWLKAFVSFYHFRNWKIVFETSRRLSSVFSCTRLNMSAFQYRQRRNL